MNRQSQRRLPSLTPAAHAGLAALLLMLAAAPTLALVLAQDNPAPVTTAQDEPATAPDPEAPPDEDADDAPLPSLDDLLDIEAPAKPATGGAAEPAERKQDAELQRELDGAQVLDAFHAAIKNMGLSADLLDRDLDAGLGTQRVQEDIIRKLDLLIDNASKMQNSAQSSSSSSSSSQSPSQQQQQPGKQNQGQQNPNTGDRQQQGNETAEGAQQMTPDDANDLRTDLDESRSEWGALPERVRDLLLQGRREKFSSLYDQLTREYYRKLAEEGSR